MSRDLALSLIFVSSVAHEWHIEAEQDSIIRETGSGPNVIHSEAIVLDTIWIKKLANGVLLFHFCSNHVF